MGRDRQAAPPGALQDRVRRLAAIPGLFPLRGIETLLRQNKPLYGPLRGPFSRAAAVELPRIAAAPVRASIAYGYPNATCQGTLEPYAGRLPDAGRSCIKF